MGRAFEVRKMAMQKTSVAKSKVYSKFGKEIYMKAKSNPDPVSNLDLKAVIDRAKRQQVPKHVIDKAIEKAKGGAGEDFKSKLFEGFGPGKSTLLIETLSDNDNRTAADVRNCFTKCDCKIAVQNAVSFTYENVSISSFKTNKNEDELFEYFLENEIDVSEIEVEDGVAEVKGSLEIMGALTKATDDLTDNEEDINMCEMTWLANELVDLNEEEKKTFDKLMNMLEELDDVQNIYHNVNL